MKPPHEIHWNEAIQQEEQAKQQRIAEAKERAELKGQMREEFWQMIGEGSTPTEIEDMVLGYGFDLDELENLMHSI